MPFEDRKGITKENYEAWKAEQEKLRLAKVNMTSPKPTPGGPEPLPRTRNFSMPLPDDAAPLTLAALLRLQKS